MVKKSRIPVNSKNDAIFKKHVSKCKKYLSYPFLIFRIYFSNNKFRFILKFCLFKFSSDKDLLLALNKNIIVKKF